MSDIKTPVAVLGAGNWGTTLSRLIASTGRRVRLWTRHPEQRDEINKERRNRRFTGDHEIPPNIDATTELAAAIEDVPTIFVIIPAKAFREVARRLGDVVRPDQVVIHGTKGLEPGTHLRMSEILLQETCARQIGVLSGPNLATEILDGQPAGTAVASKFPRVVQDGQHVLTCPQMRVFANDDVAGVEYAGAFKNVVAIGAGMATQMGLGENARAMLLTRGMGEMARLGTALGADPLTFFGMAGIGDLVATCASPNSRNHRVGAALARGISLEQAQRELGMVAEGVNTSLQVHEICLERKIELPLLERVYRVVHDGVAPAEALRELMARPPGVDIGPVFR